MSQGAEGHEKGALGDISRNASDRLSKIASAVGKHPKPRTANVASEFPFN